MRETFQLFDKLLRAETAKHLPTPALISFVETSKSHGGLFKPFLDDRKFSQHVVRSEHDAVKAMLTKDVNLFFKRGRVTDSSGRTFENISGFEYALWALDKHLWTTMLDSLPKGEASKELLNKALSQYNRVQKEGVTYWLNGRKITEQHFDFENTIIKELQTQVNSLYVPEELQDLAAIDEQWRNGVGGAQNLLPMHVIAEYCSVEKFYPVPKFTSQPKISEQFDGVTTKMHEYWFRRDPKSVIGSAICRSERYRPKVVLRLVAGVYREDVREVLWAMEALCKIRTKDFIDLKSQLENQMTVNKHPQLSPI